MPKGWLRRLLWSLAGLVIVVLLAVGAGFVWVHVAMTDSLPVIDGTLKVTGLGAPVIIRRDAHGTPHIQAASIDDLLLAQGYVTAQDRLWQMDILRRNSAGDLAEILGSTLLDHDRTQRVLQFRNVAQRVYNSLPDADRHRTEQYARGVNLFIQQNQDHLPAEFRFLHYKPHPWTGVDSILIGLNMVQILDSHWDVKLSREQISEHLHNPKLEADLYPVGSWRDQPPTAAVADMTQPHPAPSSTEDEETDQTQAKAQIKTQAKAHGERDRAPQISSLLGLETNSSVPPHEDVHEGLHEDSSVLRQLLGLPSCEGCTPGSNNWVIAGKHTASGKPLLSNDMHLGLTVPNIWYMADLSAPGLHVAGVTLPGMPLVIAGHNEHVAWGFTALYADVQDLYVEKLDGKGNYAGSDGKWLPLTHAHEVIHVRFGKDVPVDIELTPHGPLLNPLFRREKRPIALHWTLYDPAVAGIPLYEINTAANWQQFSAALGAWCWPTQNVVYADDAGHIAYHAIGKVPLRPGGLTGTPIQFSADTKQHEWQGYIPFDEMPFAYDPPSGLLATANSRVTPNDTKFPLTLEWPDPYRAERIYMDLRGRDKLTREDMLAVQTDIYSEVDQELAHRFAYAIDHTDGVDARLRQAADLLRSWDGRMSTDSAAASILPLTREAFWPLILQPKLGSDAEDYHWSESNFAEEEIIMHGATSPSDAAGAVSTNEWLPSNYKNWDALLTDAVRKGLDRGHAPTDLSHWNYGSWHVVDLEHPLFGVIPLIKNWSGTGEQPLSGGGNTIKQVGRAFGPSQRFTMDWSAPDASTENIVLGESGNAASPWFRDQWGIWYNGTTFPLPFSTSAVASQTTHTLQLVP
ncbi:penicillin acylase family protein [Acidicapsa ligni]|uniref:penicillin acylase family protein n=1 Tax=Acidicapsa ligni TaxID=542300 RepID=UPI0021DFF8E9|nr:penicillin acylase family protein [Acidicapsa ligni]